MVAESEIRQETELWATPEQVWDAVATSAGNLCWLGPFEIEPWVGGTASRGPSTVTVWDPPRRFSCRHEDEEGLSVVLEYRIEARDEKSSVLRTLIRRVHTGAVGADWKFQVDAAARHTDFHNHTLEQYLRYFDGRSAVYLQAQGPAASAAPEAFTVLRRGLGLAVDAAIGDSMRLAALPGHEPLNAVVDYLMPYFLGLRTDDGLYRFFGRNAWGWPVGLGHHLFADGIDQQETERMWQLWLNEVFT